MNRKANLVVMIVLSLSLSLTSIVLAQEVHWGYEGDIGPAQWGELSPEFALCSTGVEQSPIDIASSSSANPTDLQFDYQPTALTIVNNGHTIQANYAAGSSLQLDGQRYELLQFHFHNPSEHTVDSGATPMELHLVHQNSQGGLAVVGVFLVEGAESPAFAPVFDNMPATEGELVEVAGVTVNAAELLPSNQRYWRYNGSLTTPPCSEAVKWLVMQTPVEVSAAQIAAYTTIFSVNARPTQPLNERAFIVGQLPPTLPTTGAPVGELPPTAIVVVGVLVMLGVIRYLNRQRNAA